MNETFRNYTTSTAFSLQLSKVQCHALLLELERVSDERKSIARFSHDMPTYRALESRGLVHWERGAAGAACGFLGLTDEGRLVAQLLVAAGLTLENTMTPRTFARAA